MRVDVRYFAAAREAAGRDAESVDLGEGATLAELKGRLFEAHPDLSALDAGLRLAVGARFSALDATLADGDVVALIPPVSGG